MEYRLGHHSHDEDRIHFPFCKRPSNIPFFRWSRQMNFGDTERQWLGTQGDTKIYCSCMFIINIMMFMIDLYYSIMFMIVNREGDAWLLSRQVPSSAHQRPTRWETDENVGIMRIVAPNSVNEGSRSSKKEQTDIAEWGGWPPCLPPEND